MSETTESGRAPAMRSRELPGDRPWRDAGLWCLAVLALGALAAAYLLLAGSPGHLPRPALVDRFGLVPPLAPGASTAAAVVALAVLGLILLAALGRRRTLLYNQILLRSLDADPNGRAITGPRGRFLYGNSAFVRMMGDRPEERFARLDELVEGRAGAEQLALLRDVATGGSTGHAELRVRGAGNEMQWLKMSAYPLGFRRGYVLWCIEDITTRRQMEQAITEERAKLVDFLENASIGFYSVDGEGRFLYVNQTLGEWLGIPPDVLADGKRRLAEFVAGGVDPERPYSPFRLGRSDGRGEVTLRRDDGTEFEVEIIQTVAGSAEQGNLRTRTIVRDLTAEREFQKILHASEQRFRKLFEEAPTGIAILELDGTVADCNRAFREIAAPGLRARGMPLAELIAVDNREALSALLRAVAEGTAPPAPLDVRFANNPDRSASLYATRLEDGGGTLSGLILHFFDTTQHRALEVQFAQSQKMQAVGQLAGGIAHDFNNLLTVMIGFCDLVLQRHRPGEQTFADIMQIKQNANRAANLVRQLLAFSRQQTLQPKVLDITEVLAELSNLLRRLIGVNITLNVVHGRDLGLVKVDQVQLEQVIINLAVNARDAMRGDGGTLTIRTANVEVERPVRRGTDVMPPGAYVKIEIADTGVGIPREHLVRIFEPFFSTKEVGSGTGLGLSTVYGIVTQTGGFIQVDSEEGRGTVFEIYLPRYEEPPAEAGEAEAEAPAARDLTGVGTVLLVEDEDPVRLFGARALRNKGYKVLEAKNGDSALAVMHEAEEPIDLVISDVVMPQLDGPGLIQRVRERNPGMKVIFISGYAEDDFRESLERTPGIHFLPKPFSLEQLAGKVKEVLSE